MPANFFKIVAAATGQVAMAATLSGSFTRPRKLLKCGTSSTRKHRFESFNQRIAKLTIDPVRRRRRDIIEGDSLTETSSFFTASLERWKDLNLSENFTNFTRDVEQLCRSLPQVIHYNQRIFDLLASYIAKQDELSLEPLLDNLSNFARDLGARFEVHFSRAVTLVAMVAAKHPSVEAIEWSFTCLAWLFKYLSRLLVPNLRPVLQIMAPLLGKERQKMHTTKYAAEAMSFLVRKSATAYLKDPEPLRIVVAGIREELEEAVYTGASNVEQYKYGIMTLLINAIKGVDRRLHSSGIHVYHCLLASLLGEQDQQHSELQDVAYGVTIALIHHSNTEGLKPILEYVLNRVEQVNPTTDVCNLATLAHLLLLLSTVRKGSRIQDWHALADAGLTLLHHSRLSGDTHAEEAFQMMAVILQAAPLDIALSTLRAAMDKISDDRNERHFLPFCNYFNDLGSERFRQLLMPYFTKFVMRKWEVNKLPLLLLIPRLIGIAPKIKPKCPEGWQNYAMLQFRSLEDDNGIFVECFHFIEAMEYFSVNLECKNSIMEHLKESIEAALQATECNSITLFAMGAGLRAFARNSPSLGGCVADWWPIIRQKCGTYGTLIPFLEAVFIIAKSFDAKASLPRSDPLFPALIANLHSCSRPLRALSLQILKQVSTDDSEFISSALDIALAIENSPLDLQSARSISMKTRNLASEYAAIPAHNILQEAIPHFCFGMLHYKLSQVLDDALAALKMMSETKVGEEVISKLAFGWLQEAAPLVKCAETSRVEASKITKRSLTDFECSNLAIVEAVIHNDTQFVMSASELLQEHYNETHSAQSSKVPGAPALALRVLAAVPHIAEKRSRDLVQHLLTWANLETEESEFDATESTTVIGDDDNSDSPPWRLGDRKAMLNLFCQFTNPRVLHKASEVFEALKSLLGNGNADIQRSALKAIFTWKLPELQPYQERLLALLDDARFREEVTSFVSINDQNCIVQDGHRPILMPILLRLLYGKMTARSGTRSGKDGQVIKRKAVLEAIYRMDEQYLSNFVEIALGQLNGLRLFNNDTLNEGRLLEDVVSVRKQLGLMNMMKCMLEVLGSRLTPIAPNIIEVLLYCLLRSVRQLSIGMGLSLQAPNENLQISLNKAVRQLGIQNLNLLASRSSPRALYPYLPTLFTEVLSPRLGRLPIETAQSVSGMLRLFSTWASAPESVFILVDYDPQTLRSITDCLATAACKDHVKLFVLDEVLLTFIESIKKIGVDQSVKEHCPNLDSARYKLLQSNIEHILETLGTLLQGSPSKEILASGIRLVAATAPVTQGTSQTQILLYVSTHLLNQPSHRVSPKSKGELLQILVHFLPVINTRLPLDLQESIFWSISSLFGYFKDRENRVILSNALRSIAIGDGELQKAAILCEGLNAYSFQKLDEPDFDARLKAFNSINELDFKNFSAKQWRPLLFNMLFFIKDEDELAIRSNASLALRRFVEATSFESEGDTSELFDLMKFVLLPALRKGASIRCELVRTEHLSVMAHLIRHNPQWQEVRDMHALLVDKDEEASFFSNILHIQHHRRLRALRRLATEAAKSELQSGNVAHFFIPLLEHFIFDKADDESAHNLSAESVTTLGALAASLEWPQFRAMFLRFSGYIKSKPEVEKAVIRLLGVVIDALSQGADSKKNVPEVQEVSRVYDVAANETPINPNVLAKTMPKDEKLARELTSNLLPPLTAYLHEKDEATVSLRVPVAISITKLLKLLPSPRFEERLPPLLTDVCNILRSRAQESRDLTRRTLSEVAKLVGPAYFGFMLRELRSSLSRGYQLHVLSFTMHSILVSTSGIYNTGDLDHCLPQIVAVIMDDIFGTTGREKDAEEYISRMKEVKSSKSFDSMELLAKTTTAENLIHLVRPLQSLLDEKLDLRMIKKIDELFRRIGVGLLRSEAILDQRILLFCHELIREVYQTADVSHGGNKTDDQRTKRFLISYNGVNKSANRGTTSSYTYKLVRFSLDILRTVLHRYDTLQTPSNIHGFIPIIGDAILQSNEEIQTSALRLLTAIIKVPLKSIDDNAGVYVAECVKIIKVSTSTNTELAHAALKLVSALLRERRAVEIQETDLAYLLKRLMPDLEEPDRQGIAFNFLKAIMIRKIIVPEIYEVLDTVGIIMVTNQTRSARDMARGAYFQFIMDYPQSKERFSKQVGFLVRNLDYKHQEGRQSVMEAIHLLFTKLRDDLVQPIFGNFFVPLVMLIINDESSQCREMSGALLRTMFERADTERFQSFLEMLRSWLGRDAPPLLTRAAIQVYGIYLETNHQNPEMDVTVLQQKLAHILNANIQQHSDPDWELTYCALQVFGKMCQQLPSSAFAFATAPLWTSIRRCLSFPHAWIKLSAAQLLGIYFADFARTTSISDVPELPLKGSGGLVLTEPEIAELTRASLGLLRVPGVTEDLASQSVRNLVFLGKVMSQTSMLWPLRSNQLESHSEKDISSPDSDSENALVQSKRKLALSHVVYQSCNILRRPPLSTRAPALIPLTSALQLLAVLSKHMFVDTLRSALPMILLPLHNLTDPSISAPFSTDTAFNEGYRDLVSNATELMSKIRERFGTTEYVNILHGVREIVKERRAGRRTKRAIERVADPEKAGRDKKKKGEKKRVKRKERSGEERGRRRGW